MSAAITPQIGSEGTPMESIESTNLVRAALSSLITDLELTPTAMLATSPETSTGGFIIGYDV